MKNIRDRFKDWEYYEVIGTVTGIDLPLMDVIIRQDTGDEYKCDFLVNNMGYSKESLNDLIGKKIRIIVNQYFTKELIVVEKHREIMGL